MRSARSLLCAARGAAGAKPRNNLPRPPSRNTQTPSRRSPSRRRHAASYNAKYAPRSTAAGPSLSGSSRPGRSGGRSCARRARARRGSHPSHPHMYPRTRSTYRRRTRDQLPLHSGHQLQRALQPTCSSIGTAAYRRRGEAAARSLGAGLIVKSWRARHESGHSGCSAWFGCSRAGCSARLTSTCARRRSPSCSAQGSSGGRRVLQFSLSAGAKRGRRSACSSTSRTRSCC